MLNKNTRYHLVLITDIQKSGGREGAGNLYWWHYNRNSQSDFGYRVYYDFEPPGHWAKRVGSDFSFYLNGNYKADGVSINLDPGRTIRKSTLSESSSTPGSSSVSYYVSADGAHWEEITLGTEHTFAYPGAELRWKAELETSDISEKPEVDSIILCY